MSIPTTIVPRRSVGDTFTLPRDELFMLDFVKGGVMNLQEEEQIEDKEVLEKLGFRGSNLKLEEKRFNAGTKVSIISIDTSAADPKRRTSISREDPLDLVEYRFGIEEYKSSSLIKDHRRGYYSGNKLERADKLSGRDVFPHKWLTRERGSAPSTGRDIYKMDEPVFIYHKDMLNVLKQSTGVTYNINTRLLIKAILTATGNENPSGTSMAHYQLSVAHPARIVAYWKSCERLQEKLIRDQPFRTETTGN